ncbi:hypothetical protein KI387_037035, partial [Taxus chinensis]
FLANAGQAHSSFTRDRRTPPSRRDRLSLLSAKEMASNWLSLLHAPLGTQQRNGTPTHWTGNVCTLLHVGLATFSLHAPPSTRQHFLQRDRHTETAPPSTRQAHYRQQQKNIFLHSGTGTHRQTMSTHCSSAPRTAEMKTGQHSSKRDSTPPHASRTHSKDENGTALLQMGQHSSSRLTHAQQKLPPEKKRDMELTRESALFFSRITTL